MKKKIFTFFLALVASVGTMSAAITVRLDPSSCPGWSTVRLWAWTDSGDLFNSWPGQIVSKDSEGWYSYTFDESITSVNIIWNNGTDQTVNIEGVTSSTCYALNSTTGTQITASVVNCPANVTPDPDPDPTPYYERVKISDLYYNLDATNKTAEVTYKSQTNYIYNEDWNVTTANIPSSVTYNSVTYSVTSIGDFAFSDCSSLTSVTIPNSVTSIGGYAFFFCTGLKNVILGTSVKVLEAYAFYGCSSIETITCYGQRPPTVNQNALYGLDYSTIIYVPADYLETYKMHDAWGLYDVRPLGAKSTETTDVNVTPAENTADVAWPAVSGAATYELVIKDKGGNVICTLVFNANGQLTQIAFNAPARNNAPQQTPAAGFSFTVTGLESGTSYDLTITSKDNNGTTLDTKTISFTTSGDVPQGIDQVLSDQVQSTKVIKNGQIFILRGDKTYTLTGQETIMP